MSDMFNKFRRADERRKEDEKRQQEEYKRQSKKKLSFSLEKKHKTTFIGAIHSFEEEFGHLWGHGLPFSELTSDQVKNRRKWERCRKEILDKGNSELRSVHSELDSYDVEYVNYTYSFQLGGREDV